MDKYIVYFTNEIGPSPRFFPTWDEAHEYRMFAKSQLVDPDSVRMGKIVEFP